MYVLYLVLLGLAILSNCALIFILYYRSQRSLATISYIAFLALITIWIAPKFIMNAFHPEGYNFESLSRISALGYVFTPVAFLIFALSYATHYKIFQRLIFWFILFIPAVIFIYFSWTSQLIGVHEYTKAKLFAWGYETPVGTYFALFVAWFIGVMVSAVVVLLRYYFTITDKVKKKQVMFVLLSLLVPLAVGTFTNGILPVLGVFIFPTGLVLANITAVIIVYAIFKYGLFIMTPLSVLSSIDYAIVSVDITGYITQINPAAEKMFRAKSLHVTGTLLEELIHLEHKGRKQNNQLQKILKSTHEKGHSITFDGYTITNRKREVLPVGLSVTPVLTGGKLIGTNMFIRDGRKEEQEDMGKDDILSMLSHEVRNPITSIRAYNQLLMRDLKDSDDKKRQLVIKMDAQLDKLTRMVQNFLEFSQLQSGKQLLKRDFLSVDDFVRNLVDTMKVTYINRKIEIVGTTNNRVVFADKDKIEQVLINFITNALKYSGEDKPITLRLSSTLRSVTIGVTDYGIGIAPEYHKKVFNRYFQVKKLSPGKPGLGIGLYIASTLVKMHNGKIWVDSQPGKGSTFYFSLPLGN